MRATLCILVLLLASCRHPAVSPVHSDTDGGSCTANCSNSVPLELHEEIRSREEASQFFEDEYDFPPQLAMFYARLVHQAAGGSANGSLDPAKVQEVELDVCVTQDPDTQPSPIPTATPETLPSEPPSAKPTPTLLGLPAATALPTGVPTAGFEG